MHGARKTPLVVVVGWVNSLPGAWWVPQCMAWYDGRVGALVKPTAAAIRRLCLRPVTWWEPAGSAGGPSRGCQAVPTHTLGGSDHTVPLYGPVPATLLILPTGEEPSFACHSAACKHLIVFN